MLDDGTVRLTVDEFTAILGGFASAFPMNSEERSSWIEHCLTAELRGNLMQGLEHFGYHWLQRFTDGTTTFGAQIEVVQDAPAMAVIDANGMLSSLLAVKVMDMACEGAKRAGVFAVAVRNSPDWNMVGFGSMRALRHDCVGWLFTNSRPDVAPWGGTSRVYGHCAISAAIPAGEHYPLVMDMASNDTGGLSAQQMLIDGKMPAELFYDADGNVARDAAQWGTENINWGIHGGAQRMSGYRDLALTSVVDAFAGALTGMQCALDLAVPEPVTDGNRTPRGIMAIAFDIARFTDLAAFKAKVDRAIDQAKAARLAPGVDEIMMPGERGFREERRRRQSGIPIHPKVWADLRQLATEQGLDLDGLRATASTTGPHST